MTLEHKKIEIIQQVAASSQEDFINAIDEVIKGFNKPKYRLDLSLHSNIREKVDIDILINERPLTDFDMGEFIKEANELKWDESIEELLADLD